MALLRTFLCSAIVVSLAVPGVTAQDIAVIAAAGSARAAAAKKEKKKREAEQAAEVRVREEVKDANSAVPADPAATFQVHDGDEVHLKISKDLTSKSAKPGDPVFLELAEDIKVGDTVVARTGYRAMGEVTWVDKAGFVGTPGDLEIRLDYLRIGQRKIPLRGAAQKAAGQALPATALVLVGVGGIGLFIHGKNMEMKVGTGIRAYLGDDALLPPAPPILPVTAGSVTADQ